MAAEDWIPAVWEEDEVLVACNRCGKSGLHWADGDGRWRLMEMDDSYHYCRQRDRDRHVATQFQKLP